jgi:hypothetical protein
MAEAKSRPRVFISGSAVGYYGDRSDELLTEASSTADDFLAGLCRRWECAAQEADRLEPCQHETSKCHLDSEVALGTRPDGRVPQRRDFRVRQLEATVTRHTVPNPLEIASIETEVVQIGELWRIGKPADSHTNWLRFSSATARVHATSASASL